MSRTKTVEERIENKEILTNPGSPIHRLGKEMARLRLRTVEEALESWSEANTDYVPEARERRQIQSLKIERKALQDRLEELREEAA